MTSRRTRWTFAQVLVELAGAQSSLTRADVKSGTGTPAYEATLARARLALAEARRMVRLLARRAR